MDNQHGELGNSGQSKTEMFLTSINAWSNELCKTDLRSAPHNNDDKKLTHIDFNFIAN